MASGSRRQEGFTFVAVLIALAVIGAALAATGEVWSQARQREQEKELLFVGNQFRQAIALYYERTPGTAKQYPMTLEDLLRDARYPSMQRYLRKLYADPLSGKPEWGIIKGPDGGIMGVYSLSSREPIKTAGFTGPNNVLEGAVHYSDWRFQYEPTVVAPPEAPAQETPAKDAPGKEART